MAGPLSTRLYHTNIRHLDNGLAVVCGNWAIGATGAVGAKEGGVGLTLARTATGLYTLTLVDGNGDAGKAPYILAVHLSLEEADADPSDDTGAYGARVLIRTASTGVITTQTHDEAYVARDPASGAVYAATVIFKLSTISR